MDFTTTGINQNILDSICAGVFTVDSKFRIRTFNQEAEKITGVSKSEAIGHQCCEVFRSNICESDCALRWTLETKKPLINKISYIVNAEGEEIPISITTALLFDDAGKTIGGVETFRDLRHAEEQLKEFKAKYSFSEIIGRSNNIQRLFDIIPSIAEIDCTVLLEGESGTGKELFAKAIHNLSPRRKGPLVSLNCAAFPDTLIESELFGYKAGSFTGARKDKPGRFTLANGGTLFLDEIGDISQAIQVRLLRILQERVVEPLGSTKPEQVDVRVVVATNKNLENLVEIGDFRDDLYYRINVVKLVLPSLRERIEDIPLLVDHFIARFNRLYKKHIEGLSPKALSSFMRYSFPGNVRELENAIEHAFVYCHGSLIKPEHLPKSISGITQFSDTKDWSYKDFEVQFLVSALERNQWNKKKTALELGIDPSTLWRKMKKYNLKKKE